METEVYPDQKPLGKQLQYASRKGFRLALIAGSDEFAAGEWQIKDLAAGQQQKVAEGDLTGTIASLLGRRH